MEEQIYTEECIPGIKIEYADNQGCIDLIEKAPSGIFKLLDSQCKTPKARHATSSSSLMLLDARPASRSLGSTGGT